MNKKIISSVLAAIMFLTVSTSNIYAISANAENNSSKTESKEKSTQCNVHFVLFVPESFKDAQKEVMLTFRGNGEEFSGLLEYSGDYNLNIKLEKGVSYELTFSGDIEGYEILGVEPYVYFEEDDNIVSITMANFDGMPVEEKVGKQLNDDLDLTEEEIIVKNYVEKLNAFMEEHPDEINYIAGGSLQNYLKKSGTYYNTETWDSLTDTEQRLFWILYDKPRTMFKDKYELLQPEDIIKSDVILSNAYDIGGGMKEFVELTTDELWVYQLQKTKTTGSVPDYFTIYMDLKNKTSNESVAESESDRESKNTEESLIVTTTTSKVSEPVEATTTSKNQEVKKAAKEVGDNVIDTLKQNKITIILLLFATIGIIVFRAIGKIKRKYDYNEDEE